MTDLRNHRPNYSSPFAPERLVNVTLWRYHNAYKYDQQLLWITYGLSLAGATLAVAGGMIALILNRASYSDNFSTVFRVSQTAQLNVDMKDNDGLGQDPLPKYLKHATLDLKPRENPSIVTGTKESGTSAESESLVVEQTNVVEEQSDTENPPQNSISPEPAAPEAEADLSRVSSCSQQSSITR